MWIPSATLNIAGPYSNYAFVDEEDELVSPDR